MPQLIPDHVHEKTDAHVKPVALFLAAVFVVVIFSAGFTTLLFEFLEQRAQSKTNAASPVQTVDETPPGPQLQATPGLDLRRQQQVEQERYEGYGWVDEGAGLAHIPVEEAIDLLLEKGLPTRGAEATAPAESE